MASKIEWTNETWNPVTGCSKVSAGCKNCYAERMAKRFSGRFGYPEDDPFRVTIHSDRLDKPTRWQKPRMIFVCSMSDLFHEDVPDDFIDRVFGVMLASAAFGNRNHTFQVLTKRPSRMARYLNKNPEVLMTKWSRAIEDSTVFSGGNITLEEMVYGYCLYHWDDKGVAIDNPGEWGAIDNLFPLPNVWLGTTVENQLAANDRVPQLLRCPAVVRFLSCEPLLEAVTLNPNHLFRESDLTPTGEFRTHQGNRQLQLRVKRRAIPQIQWLIVGGESGPGARPMEADWARSIRDQCVKAQVPFFFKQWGGANKKKTGRELDGRTWNEMPVIATK